MQTPQLPSWPRRSSNAGALPEIMHPLEELLLRLPLLSVSEAGRLELDRASPTLLHELAESAQDSASAINLGLAAVGSLLAHSAVSIEDGSIGADTIEALGWLLGELGIVAAYCQTLTADCQAVQWTKHVRSASMDGGDA